MTAGPNTNSTECNREKLVNTLRDEALIKQLEAAIYSNEIWKKALDVVCKRIASGQVSDNMLLHVVVSLSKSTAVFSRTARIVIRAPTSAFWSLIGYAFDGFGRTKPNSLIKSDQGPGVSQLPSVEHSVG
jgi:hypothetical protein